jgi:hypothetical protein
MNKEQLTEMYISTGCNSMDFKDDLKQLGHYPNHESFDNSLSVYTFTGFLVIVDTGNVIFIDTIN